MKHIVQKQGNKEVVEKAMVCPSMQPTGFFATTRNTLKRQKITKRMENNNEKF